MSRVFLSNLALLLVINGVIKPFYVFGIDRTVQNAVGAENYGIFFTLLSFCYLFQIVQDAGLQQYNTRFVARNREKIRQHLPDVMGTKGVLGGLFLILVYAAGFGTGYSTAYTTLFLWVAGNLVLDSWLLFLRTNLTGLGKYRAEVWMSALDKGIMIILCGILLLWSDDFILEYFLVCQTLSFLIPIGVCMLLLRSYNIDLSFQFDLRKAWSLLRRSGPYALTVFLMYAYTKVDGVMLEQMLEDGPYQNGVYAAGYRILDAVNMVGFLFATLLLPMFSNMLSRNESVNELAGLSFRLIWVLSVITAFICYFYQWEIADLLYVEATPYWGIVLGLLMLSFIARSVNYIYGTLLTARGAMGAMNRLFIACLMLNVVLNLVIIPEYKSQGAAVTTLITQGMAALGLLILSLRTTDLRSNMPLLGKALLFALLFAAGIWGIREWVKMHWIIQLFLAGILGLGCSYWMKLLPLELIPTLMGQKKI